VKIEMLETGRIKNAISAKRADPQVAAEPVPWRRAAPLPYWPRSLLPAFAPPQWPNHAVWRALESLHLHNHPLLTELHPDTAVAFWDTQANFGCAGEVAARRFLARPMLTGETAHAFRGLDHGGQPLALIRPRRTLWQRICLKRCLMRMK